MEVLLAHRVPPAQLYVILSQNDVRHYKRFIFQLKTKALTKFKEPHSLWNGMNVGNMICITQWYFAYLPVVALLKLATFQFNSIQFFILLKYIFPKYIHSGYNSMMREPILISVVIDSL